MTAWLASGSAPGQFALGEDCELTGGEDNKAVVRYVRHPLQPVQVRKHLDEGFRVTRLALTWSGRIGLVVNEKLQIKRVNFLDIDENAKAETKLTPEEKFEADFALMTGEYTMLLNDLLDAFGVDVPTKRAAAARAHGEHAAV
jgi:recombination associated protein RdgC